MIGVRLAAENNQLERMFYRPRGRSPKFFPCAREAGRGLGMGLPKCWRIVREHGGRIDVESGTERMTTFKIVLPAQNSPKR